MCPGITDAGAAHARRDVQVRLAVEAVPPALSAVVREAVRHKDVERVAAVAAGLINRVLGGGVDAVQLLEVRGHLHRARQPRERTSVDESRATATLGAALAELCERPAGAVQPLRWTVCRPSEHGVAEKRSQRAFCARRMKAVWQGKLGIQRTISFWSQILFHQVRSNSLELGGVGCGGGRPGACAEGIAKVKPTFS